MGFTLIKGTFHVVNYSPDGDSIRFQPVNRSLVEGLENGSRARFNARGHVQLRFEAVDTLETHFSPPGGGTSALHQPLDLAWAAVDDLLSYLGITDVSWDAAHRNVISASDGVPGCILARSVERNGRPVAFVFKQPPAEDGADVFLDVEKVKSSYNWRSISAGLAYPTFYKGLFADLRDALAEETRQARAAGRGIHHADRTNDGFDAASLSTITDEVSLLPKLFRRLSDYMVNMGTARGFKQKLELAREPVLDLTQMNFTHFDTFIEQAEESTHITLTRMPEDLVFDETIPQPGPVFAEIVNEVAQPKPLIT